jgi:PDZ domain-containing secreted protein
MNIRTRAAQIRSRWLRTGLHCELSLEELTPLFAVYADTPKGKVVIVDKTQPITLENLKSLSYDEYQTYKLDVKARAQAAAHHTSLKRFNQPIHVSINDIYQMIRDKLDSKKKCFSLKDSNSAVTIENLILLSNGRTEYFLKLRKNAEQKIIFWRNKSFEPMFTITQLTEKMEAAGYQIIGCKKGIGQRERLRIIDSEMPLTLNNIEVLVKVGDERRVKLSL